jgi:hypothetical protein
VNRLDDDLAMVAAVRALRESLPAVLGTAVVRSEPSA